jgi:hypothetical protein
MRAFYVWLVGQRDCAESRALVLLLASFPVQPKCDCYRAKIDCKHGHCEVFCVCWVQPERVNRV